MSFLPVLQKCPLFRGIDPVELPVLLECLGAKTVTAEKRQTILREGEPARFVGVVLEGGVQILQEDYFGNRSILGLAETGELFGESFACAATDSLPVSVVAARDSVLLLVDCRRVLSPCEKACGFHRTILSNLMQIMARKNLAFHQKLQITSRRTTREKLLAYLNVQAKIHGSPTFSIPFDRQELADYLGVERSGLSTEIGRLRAEGVLECQKNHFILLEKTP